MGIGQIKKKSLKFIEIHCFVLFFKLRFSYLLNKILQFSKFYYGHSASIFIAFMEEKIFRDLYIGNFVNIILIFFCYV